MPDVSAISINATSYAIKDTPARNAITDLDLLAVSYEAETETISFNSSKPSIGG